MIMQRLIVLEILFLIIAVGTAMGTGCSHVTGPAYGYPDTDSETDSGDADPVFIVDTSEAECIEVPWSATARPVNMLILLDRSASMEKHPADAREKYADTVRQAVDAIVAEHTDNGDINFALNVFPSPKACTSEYGALEPWDHDSVIDCQAASRFVDDSTGYDAPLVPFALAPFASDATVDIYSAIHRALYEVGTCGGTPMAASLRWARAYLDSLDLENDTYILLATDGAPGCNVELDFYTCESATVGEMPMAPEMCLDDLQTVAAISELEDAGYQTFVLGVGQTVAAFADTMETIAYWGTHGANDDVDFWDIPSPPDGGTWHYPVGDVESMNAALHQITETAVSCVYNVNWEDISDKSGINQSVAATCAQTQLFGVPAGGETEIPLTLMRSCSLEDADATDPRLHLGWTWAEFEGMGWDDINALEGDAAKCVGVRLCPAACAHLQAGNANREWDGVSAILGCHPKVVVQ